MGAVIEVKNLSKMFDVPDKEWMEKASPLKRLFIRKYSHKLVLENLNFSIKEGEMVGYIGMNGAGKTTTLKILSGILEPTSGEVKVLGKEPYKNRKNLAKHISVVFGNRELAFFDIPLWDSIEFYGKIYSLTEKEIKERAQYLAELLDLKDILSLPVRKMSFGQRRKANILLAFLHKPKIVLLDEPTIGLDIFAKEKVREFLETMNKKENTTIVLTSHYLEDIERLANRIILIDKGRIIEDAPYKEIINKLGYKIITLYGNSNKIKTLLVELGKDATILKEDTHLLQIAVKKSRLTNIIEIYHKHSYIEDIEIRNPSLEEILKEVYYGGY